jgi:hypothetical protein
MPQLDTVTFFSQFFWLCFFYLGFYGVVVKFILPKFGRIFKLRENKLRGSSEGVTSLHQEKSKVIESVSTVLDAGVQSSKDLVQSTLETTSNWVDGVLQETNTKQWKGANISYLTSVGEKSLSQQLGVTLTFPKVDQDLRSCVLVTQLVQFAQAKAKETKRR